MRPKHRPPRPKHPKFTHFHRSGLRFGRFPAQRRSIGGVGRHRRAWLRCRWAAAGPGRASRRRTKPHVSTPGTTGVEGTGGPGRGAGGWRRDLAGLRDDAPSHTSAHQAPPVWRAPEGSAAVPVGGGRARAGLEIDHSERSSRVVDLAGGPPPTGTHSGRTPQSSPARQVRPDGARNTRGGHKQPGPAGARQRLRLGDLAARLAQGQAAVAVDGGTHVDEARTRQERRVGAGAKLADGVQAFGGEAPSELGHEVGH